MILKGCASCDPVLPVCSRAPKHGRSSNKHEQFAPRRCAGHTGRHPGEGFARPWSLAAHAAPCHEHRKRRAVTLRYWCYPPSPAVHAFCPSGHHFSQLSPSNQTCTMCALKPAMGRGWTHTLKPEDTGGGRLMKPQRTCMTA